MWGQGIPHNRKFATLVASRAFQLSFPPAGNFAHSGAPLGSAAASDGEFDPRDGTRTTDGEVPRSNPSIFRQLLAAGIRNAATGAISASDLAVTYPNVRVVFLNGGINDIGSMKIVRGELGDVNEVRTTVNTFSETGLLKLMKRARQKFPHAKLVVVGYHYVLSHRSLLDKQGTLSAVLDESNGAIKDFRKGVRTSSYFAHFTNAAKQRAVDAFNRVDTPAGGTGAIFVPTLHGWEHATFADKALSFGLGRVSGGGIVRYLMAIAEGRYEDLHQISAPEDAVANRRRTACALRHPGGISGPLVKCNYASVFHPNEANAQRVAGHSVTVANLHRNPPSVATMVGNKFSLRGALSALGHTGPTGYRQVFATDMVSCIQVRGVIREGSYGSFPYHLLKIEFRMRDNSTERFPLNAQLPFVRGFADAWDDLFPGAQGKVNSNGNGLSSVSSVERDTEFRFFAYPTRSFLLHQVADVSVGCHQPSGLSRPVSFNVDRFTLWVNGRSLPVSTHRFNFRTGAFVMVHSEILQ